MAMFKSNLCSSFMLRMGAIQPGKSKLCTICITYFRKQRINSHMDDEVSSLRYNALFIHFDDVYSKTTNAEI